MKVLIVDDEEHIRLILSRIAKNKFNAEVLEAKNGLECLSILKSTKPDLIFLDVHMPKLNGKETLELIRQNKETAKIPVTINSSLKEKELVVELLSLGVSDYIQKPFDTNQTNERISRLILNTHGLNKTHDRLEPLEKDVKLKLLLVNRDESFLNLFIDSFNERFEIIKAKDELEAYEIFLNHEVHFILLYENQELFPETLFTKKVRSLDRNKQIKVVLLTENPDRFSTDFIYFDAVLKKSSSKEELLDNFNKLFKR